MSTVELDDRIAAKTRDAAPPTPLPVALWATYSDSAPELERTYDLNNATDLVMLLQDQRSYAWAQVNVEIRTGGAV